MNNEIIIGFGFRMIGRIMQIKERVPLLGLRSASADNTLFNTHNSSYRTEPHPIIGKYWQNKCELTLMLCIVVLLPG